MMDRRAQLFRKATAGKIPLTVSLEITHRCNFRCRHCYIPDLNQKDGVTTPRLHELLDECVAMGTLYLTITGGEPFVRRDWKTIVEGARNRGFDVRLFTNGALVNEEIAADLARLQVAVEITLHSMDQETFENTTQIPGSFEQTQRAIKILGAAGVTMKLKMPIIAANADHINEVAAFARSVGAEFFSDPRIMHRKDGDKGPVGLQVPPKNLLPYYRSKNTHYAPVSPISPPVSGDTKVSDGVLCSAGWRTVNITAAGDVLGCTLLPEVAGNINEKSFKEIWENSPWFLYLRSLRRQDLNECDTCAKYAYCARCPAQALVNDGDLLGPSLWSCEHAAALDEAFGDGEES